MPCRRARRSLRPVLDRSTILASMYTSRIDYSLTSNEFCARIPKWPSLSSPAPLQLAAPARAGGRDAPGDPRGGAAAVRAQGYAATTMAAIAAEAGVALKTVYVAFETKSGVLRALWNLLLRGDHDEVPVAERQWYREVVEEPDPERQLRLNAHNSRVVKQRIAALLEVIRSAAPVDADIDGAVEPDRDRVLRQPARDRREPAREERAAARPRRRAARPTSSGRSTTRTSGSCSSASAAGRPSATSSGGGTSRAGSFWRERWAETLPAQGLRRAGSAHDRVAGLEQRLQVAEHEAPAAARARSSSSPAISAAVCGAPSSSWVTVSLDTPPSRSARSRT